MTLSAAEGWQPVAPDGTFIALLGPHWRRDLEDGCALAIALGPHLRNLGGNLHGGAVVALMDRAAGLVARATYPGRAVATATLTVNFLRRSPPSGYLQVSARLRKSGRSAAFIDIEAEAGGRLLANAVSLFMPAGAAAPTGDQIWS